MCNFLKDHDTVRSDLKENLAKLFGQAHLFCINEDYQKLSEVLYDIAVLDNKFRDLCLHYKEEWKKWEKRRCCLVMQQNQNKSYQPIKWKSGFQ